MLHYNKKIKLGRKRLIKAEGITLQRYLHLYLCNICVCLNLLKFLSIKTLTTILIQIFCIIFLCETCVFAKPKDLSREISMSTLSPESITRTKGEEELGIGVEKVGKMVTKGVIPKEEIEEEQVVEREDDNDSTVQGGPEKQNIFKRILKRITTYIQQPEEILTDMKKAVNKVRESNVGEFVEYTVVNPVIGIVFPKYALRRNIVRALPDNIKNDEKNKEKVEQEIKNQLGGKNSEQISRMKEKVRTFQGQNIPVEKIDEKLGLKINPVVVKEVKVEKKKQEKKPELQVKTPEKKPEKEKKKPEPSKSRDPEEPKLPEQPKSETRKPDPEKPKLPEQPKSETRKPDPEKPKLPEQPKSETRKPDPEKPKLPEQPKSETRKPDPKKPKLPEQPKLEIRKPDPKQPILPKQSIFPKQPKPIPKPTPKPKLTSPKRPTPPRRPPRRPTGPPTGAAPTRGDGSCGIHAVWGEWNGSQYAAPNAPQLRADLVARLRVIRGELGRLQGLYLQNMQRADQQLQEMGLLDIYLRYRGQDVRGLEEAEREQLNLALQIREGIINEYPNPLKTSEFKEEIKWAMQSLNTQLNKNYDVSEIPLNEFDIYITAVARPSYHLILGELFILAKLKNINFIARDRIGGVGHEWRTTNPSPKIVHIYNSADGGATSRFAGSHWNHYNPPAAPRTSDFILEPETEEEIEDLAKKYAVKKDQYQEVGSAQELLSDEYKVVNEAYDKLLKLPEAERKTKFTIEIPKEIPLPKMKRIQEGTKELTKLTRDIKIDSDYGEMVDFLNKNRNVDLKWVSGISNDYIAYVANGRLFVRVNEKLKDETDPEKIIILAKGLLHEVSEFWLKHKLKTTLSEDEYKNIEFMLENWRDYKAFKGYFEGAVDSLVLWCIKQGWLGTELNIDNLSKAYDSLFSKKVGKEMLAITENSNNREEQVFDMLALLKDTEKNPDIAQVMNDTQKTHVVLHYA